MIPQAEIEYQFRFTTTYANPNTFLYNTGQVTTLDDADLNVRQTYSVTEVNKATGKTEALGKNLPVPPANVGPRSTPDYEANLGSKGVKSLGDGIKVFAGPRDDPVLRRPGEHLRPGRPAAVQPRPPDPAARPRRARTTWPVTTSTASPSRSRRAELLKGNEKTIGVWATTYRRAQRIAQREASRAC